MLSASSCATLTLNGCRRVTTCGSVVVADCDGQLTCVGGDGSIVHSEPFDPARATCSRCTGPADDGSAAQSRVATHSAVDECGH